jgi:hypothetical protein
LDVIMIGRHFSLLVQVLQTPASFSESKEVAKLVISWLTN